jgi:hypothetical protein
MHDRLACREDPLGIRIAGRIRQVADHVELDFLGRIETERRKIADVQLDDLVPFVLHLLGLLQYRSANVVTDVGQLVRFEYGFHIDKPMRLAIGRAVLSECIVDTTNSATSANACERGCA